MGHLNSQLEEAELASRTNNTGKTWKIVNTITNRKSSPTGKLKGKSPDERKTQWFNHFKSLLVSIDVSTSREIDPIFPNVNIEDTALDEVGQRG